jgi:hypothetical protein
MLMDCSIVSCLSNREVALDNPVKVGVDSHVSVSTTVLLKHSDVSHLGNGSASHGSSI